MRHFRSALAFVAIALAMHDVSLRRGGLVAGWVAALMVILNPLDVPCGPIMSTEDLANDEHVRGRDMWVELDHPQRGKWFNVGMPIKLSASPAQIKRSPTLGEHTEEILRSVLGYDDSKISALKTAGAFSIPPKKAA